MTVDLWQYIAPATEPGNLNGRPVGVTQNPGGDAIHQAQLEAHGSRRVFHTKGTHGVPADFEELYVEGDYILRAIDTSRPAKDGGPYTLHDALTGRGSRWAKRYMALGDVFERNPYVSPFSMQTGQRGAAGGPVRTWLKLAAVHPKWRGVDDVIELWWLTGSPTQTSAEERYFYGKGLGLVGFEGPGLTTYPNHVWDKLPPAAGVPVLTRKALNFALPPVGWVEPAPVPALPAGLPPLQLYKPLRQFVISSPFDSPRSYPAWPNVLQKHEGIDLDTEGDLTVYAAADGVVDKVAYSANGYGHYARIVVPGGWQMWYAHLAGTPLVTEGQTVKAGTPLGTMGATGNVFGTNPEHLHFTLARPDKPNNYTVSGAIDPTPYILRALPVPDLTPVVTPSPVGDTPPVTTIPLPELSPDPAVRAQTVALLRWLADVIEAAP